MKEMLLFFVDLQRKRKKLMEKVNALLKEERDHEGVRAIDNETISSITSHEAGYIDKDLEMIV